MDVILYNVYNNPQYTLMPILKMRKLNHGEFKELVQGPRLKVRASDSGARTLTQFLTVSPQRQ